MRRTLAGLLGVAGLVTLTGPLPAGARSGSGFIDGSGSARGTTVRLAPHTGGLSYAITNGETIASYQGTEGRAQSQALDLGIFALILTNVSACGREPPFKPDQLPGPVEANSSHGPATASHTFAGNDIAAGGVETATARPDTSSADADGVVLNIPGVLTVRGATSHAQTRLVPGTRREAHAEASIASVDIAGGTVRLLGLHWDVTQHTGDHPVRDGGFRIDRIILGGQALPAGPANQLLDGLPEPGEQVVQSLGQANDALRNVGLQLIPPAVRTLQDGTVQVTPLRISIGGETRLSQPLGSALAAGQPLRDAILGVFNPSSGSGGGGSGGGGGGDQQCKDPRDALRPLVNAGLLVADIAYGGLTGTGGLDVDLGGVHAMTEGIAYRNPFGDFLPLPPSLGSTSVSDTAEPGTETVVPPPPAAQSAPPQPPAVIAPATAGRSFSSCVSTHVLALSGCTRDLARLAAGVGLGVALLLFAGDAALLLRRRPRGTRP